MDKEKQLASLQSETKEKENIVLLIYSGMLAFSITGLLSTIAYENHSILILISILFFITSTVSLSIIVLAKFHILHKANDIHIVHVIVSEDHAEHPRTIGITSMAIGLLLMLADISIYIAAFSIALITIGLKQHLKFMKEMKSLKGAREV